MEDALTHIELITTECSPAMSAPEIAAFGVAIIIPDDVPSSILMEVLVLKISKPEEFLPVSGAVMRPSDDGQGNDD